MYFLSGSIAPLFVSMLSEKETPLSFRQEKKRSTHQPVEGEKE
jgi:hypothetical protein